MSNTVGVSRIKAASNVLENSLSFFQNVNGAVKEMMYQYIDKKREYDWAVQNIKKFKNQVLSIGGLDEEDTRRLKIDLYTRNAVPYTEKYKDNPALLDALMNYVRWVSMLGSEPPRFFSEDFPEVSGGLTHLRQGIKYDLNNIDGMIQALKRDFNMEKAKVRESIENAEQYKQEIENEIAAVEAINVEDYVAPVVPASGTPSGSTEFYHATKEEQDKERQIKTLAKETVLNNLRKDRDFWGRVVKHVQLYSGTGTDPYDLSDFTFSGLGYISSPGAQVSYEVDSVWFDEQNREYVIELLFDGLPNQASVFDLSLYKINQGVLINTITVDGYTEEQLKNFNLTNLNFRRVILRTKFGIIPNREYDIDVNLPNMASNFGNFIRRVYPKPARVSYFKDNELHIKFDANIDLDIEGIREETELVLDRIEVSKVENYSIVDSYGKDVPVVFALLESDLRTATLVLGNAMENRLGYIVTFQNFAFENGGAIRDVYNNISFSYSDPFPVLGLSGFYEKEHEVVILGWLPSVQEVEGYNIYRKQSISGGYEKLTEFPIVGERYIDATAKAGRRYDYVVTVVNMAGEESVNSEVFNIILKAEG